MADYTEIKGNRIQYLDSDPTLTSANEGQVWYNTATGTLKGLVQLQAWSSASSANTARFSAGGAGTLNASVVYGGANTAGTALNAQTEEYNGSGFSTSGNINTARQDGGSCGTQTAALYTGGEAAPGNVTSTEEYDGTTWTAVNANPSPARGWASGGIQTAAFITTSSTTAEYDGTSWTSGNPLTSPRGMTGGGTGVQTAGLVAGGSPSSNLTEEYDGTSFSAGGNMNTGRQQGKMSGSQTDGIFYGGEAPPGNTTATENYNGTSWTTSPASLAGAIKNNSG